MPMDKVSRRDAISKREVHRRFRIWLQTTDEAIIGPGNEYGKSAYIHVRDGERLFEFDPDTKRKAVEEYMQLVDRLGEDLEWKAVENAKGNMTAVAFGPDSVRLENKLYLYFLE